MGWLYVTSWRSVFGRPSNGLQALFHFKQFGPHMKVLTNEKKKLKRDNFVLDILGAKHLGCSLRLSPVLV